MHAVQSPAARKALRALARRPRAADRLVPAAIQAGATTREIAAVLGIDPTTVGRRWGSQPARGPRPRHDVTDKEVLTLRRRGLSIQAIADLLSEQRPVPVSRGLVRARLCKYGLASNGKRTSSSSAHR